MFGYMANQILAIDYGHKHIGIAISDESNTIAIPCPVLSRTPQLHQHIIELCQQHQVGMVVVGMPLNQHGTYGHSAKQVLQFVETLKSKLELPITLVDERFSTSFANRLLISMDTSRNRRKEKIDSLAAACLLESYLLSKQSGLSDT